MSGFQAPHLDEDFYSLQQNVLYLLLISKKLFTVEFESNLNNLQNIKLDIIIPETIIFLGNGRNLWKSLQLNPQRRYFYIHSKSKS